MIQKPSHLAYYLDSKIQLLDYICDNINRYYRESIKNERKTINGKSIIKNRTITESLGELKRTQTLLVKKVFSQIRFSDKAYGGIKGRDNIQNAKQHFGNKYKFVTDIRDFFPSISNDEVYSTFISLGFSPDVSRYITKLTTYKYSLPQGAPTSTHIANIVFIEHDNVLSKYCSEKGITYTRFVDDLSFSAQENFKEDVGELLSIIESNGYKRSHKKTVYKEGICDITGILVGDNWLDVKKSIKDKIQEPDRSDASKEGIRRYRKRVRSAV